MPRRPEKNSGYQVALPGHDHQKFEEILHV